VKLNYPMLKNIEISGLQISDYRKRTPELMQHCYAQLFELVTSGRITPPPVDVRRLGDWRSAVEDLAERKATSRLVLRPEPMAASPKHSQQ
jgi:NADPH2:quinone reductase